LYAVIAANVTAVTVKIALACDGFETRPMAESLSMRPTASFLIFTEWQESHDARRVQGSSVQAPKRSDPVSGGRIQALAF
jgi:hypothetical protein